MANIMDLLGDGMKTVRKNNNISLLYILYQVRFYHRTDIRADIGYNKNASQLDAYRPLQWPQESVYIPACTGQGCVYPSMHWPEGVYPSMHWAGGVSAWGCVPRGCIPACTGQGVCLPGVVYPGGCLPRGCLLGVSALGRGCLPVVSAPVHAGIHTPHEQNHRHLWKHNLAATTLRMVIKISRILRQARIRLPTLALNPREGVSEVQNRGISGSTKRTYVLQKKLK